VGVVCGLGAAAAAWTIAGSPNLLEAECLAFVTLAALAGSARRLARSAAVGAALLVFGLGAALVVAESVTVAAWLGRRGPRGPLYLLGLLHALAVAAIAALLPGLAYLGLGGSAPIELGRASWIPVLGAIAASVVTTQTLAALARPTIVARSWWRTSANEILGAGIALVVALVYATDLRAWLLLLPVAAAISHLGATPRRRPARVSTASETVQRAIAEALARASTARGRVDLAHLDRVEALAIDLASEAGLAEPDCEALAIAALLHEVDDVTLPESVEIVEGQLEPHPALGAELLGALPLPETTRAIVRHRTERWDGTGRPAGLVGESIPLGARILAVVDAFDEWTWAPGPRRGAEGAIERLRAAAGTRFDPRVVEILERRARSEGLGQAARARRSSPTSGRPSTRLRDAARELHALYEIERSVGYRLDLDENLLLILGKLQTLVPHDTAAVYALEETTLRARFALGAAASALEALELPVDRLSSRVAHARRTLVGGARDGFDLTDLANASALGLATELAAPLVLGDRTLGTLTLYAGPERRFDAEDRRIVTSVAGHVAAALCRSDPQHASYLATLTDPDTGLPNARYLEICASDAVAFGLVAFRWLDFETTCERGGIDEATRAMGVLGRRIAAACGPHEVASRFGTDLFLVLAADTEPGVLVERWGALLHAAEAEPIVPGVAQRVRCASAQASAPADGRTLDALLSALGARLGPTTLEGARVVPFRSARSTG
jgi:GGDEF domain-containing protein